MKAFVFTLDAIFSLIFAATAISALVYVSYSGYSPPTVQSAEVSSLSSVLASSGLLGLSQTSPLYGAGTSGTWPQYGASEGFSFGAPYGPTGPYLLFSYATAPPANIIPAVVVANGYVAFAAGSQLYEVNATTGLPMNNYPVGTGSSVVAAPVYYRNLLIYANSIGYVTAVSASNGLVQVWKTSVGGGRVTTPLEIDEGYVVFGFNTPTTNSIYFLDPANGSVVENDPVAGSGPMVSWIAHRKGQYYIGVSTAKPYNSPIRNEYANVSFYPANSFASYGNFSAVDNQGTAAMYSNLTAYYSKSSGLLNLTSVPYYSYSHMSSFSLPAATFNTTPSIGGNTTYLLYNGVYFQAFTQGGQLFNVILPGSPTFYNYSDIALAYGNAYFTQGNTLYAFGPGGFLQQNSSVLAALGDLYLTGRGGLADYILYNTYGSGNIGIFVNASYGPSLHVAKFDGYDSYITMPNSIALDSPSAMSVCAWIYPYSVGSQAAIVAKSDGTASAQFELRLLGATNTIQFVTDTSGGGYNGATFSTALVANAWYHVCGVNNGASIYSYVNGVASSAVGMGGNINIESAPLTIGERFAASSTNFNGLIADVQLYNSVLSQGRISQIYSGGAYSAPPNLTGLVGWWPLLGDGNDYGGGGHVGFPTNVLFISSNYIPPSLSKAAEIGRSSIPLQLTNNGVSNIFNVSVVVWTS
jgi:hypothetical protein